MFKEPVFSLLNRIFIRNRDSIQSLTIIEMTINDVYN